MKINWFVGLALMSYVLITLSCSEEDSPQICTLNDMRSTAGDSIVYFFNAAKRLSKITHYIADDPYEEVNLEYDNNGRLKTVVRKLVYDVPQVYKNYELVYDNDKKPKSLNSWGALTTLPPVVTDFSYDTKGRLIEREVVSYGPATRYEYDSHDNIVKFFRTSSGNPEYLMREVLSIDDSPRCFASISDYEFLCTYVYGIETSKNNALTATEYPFPGSGGTIGNVIYAALYNEQGLIRSYYRQTTTAQIFAEEFLFQQAHYNCQ